MDQFRLFLGFKYVFFVCEVPGNEVHCLHLLAFRQHGVAATSRLGLNDSTLAARRDLLAFFLFFSVPSY